MNHTYREVGDIFYTPLGFYKTYESTGSCYHCDLLNNVCGKYDTSTKYKYFGNCGPRYRFDDKHIYFKKVKVNIFKAIKLIVKFYYNKLWEE